MGLWEILIILVIIVAIFGAKRLPQVGESLGKSVNEFKSAAPGRPQESSTEEPQPAADGSGNAAREREGGGTEDKTAGLLPLAADIVKIKAPGGKMRLLSRLAKKL